MRGWDLESERMKLELTGDEKKVTSHLLLNCLLVNLYIGQENREHQKYEGDEMLK